MSFLSLSVFQSEHVRDSPGGGGAAPSDIFVSSSGAPTTPGKVKASPAGAAKTTAFPGTHPALNLSSPIAEGQIHSQQQSTVTPVACVRSSAADHWEEAPSPLLNAQCPPVDALSGALRTALAGIPSAPSDPPNPSLLSKSTPASWVAFFMTDQE